MHQFFIHIYHLINNNKKKSFFVFFGLFVVLLFFATKLRFEEDITRIIPKNDKADVVTKVLKQVNFSDKITILIEGKSNESSEDLIECANQFVEKTSKLKPYIKNIQGVIASDSISETYDFVYQNLPLFLNEDDYKQIEQKLIKDSIVKKVQENFVTLTSPSGLIAKDFIVKDPLNLGFIAMNKLQQLNSGNDFIVQDGYIFTKDKKALLLFISPKLGGSETEKNTFFVNELKTIQKDLNSTFKNKAELNYFGSSFIAVANAEQIKSDIFKTVFISLTTLLLILIFFYKKWLMPIIVFIPTVFGVLFALLALYFLRDTISAISLSVGAVLLGVTIDYSLHILTHYRSNNNVENLYKEITKPLIMSSSTTALAFLCLLFVNSEALKDLGIFAAISVMVSSLFSLLLIPHIYKPNLELSLNNSGLLNKLASYEFEKNKVLFAICSLLIIVSLFIFKNVSFDNNISKLNFVPTEIKKVENKLDQFTNFTSKSIYVAAYGTSLDSCIYINNQLLNQLNQKKENKEILNVSSIGGLVLSNAEQQKKIDLWNTFWKNKDKKSIESILVNAGSEVGFKPETHQEFYKLLQKDFKPIEIEAYKKLNLLHLDEFISEKDGFYTVTSLVKIDKSKRDAFVNYIDTQKQCISIDRQNLNETFLGRLVEDFNNLINYSFIAVVLILFVFFKRIELVILSVIPIALTGLVTAGLMNLFGIQLNIFSTIVCTLIFGHGVDFSIFMTSALQHQYTTGNSDMRIYRTSIILAALTTILAIGALIFAKHPALISISSVSLIGVFAALLITFVFYPILFKFVIFRNPNKGKSNTTLLYFVFSCICFFYYGFGGLFFSFIGRYLLLILPISNLKKREYFSKFTSFFMKTVIQSFPFCKLKVINTVQEDFSKPSIIIANHASFLDTISLGSLYPKMIFFVNDWVYNSPIFGGIVKMQGYYPVSKGVEGSIEHLKTKLEEGYHVVIFPEGTRSRTNKINRFHKGAFYLAEKLNVDILPIYIHGNADLIPKGYFSIFGGPMNIVVGSRIRMNSFSSELSLKEKTKEISNIYKSEFVKIRNQFESATFYNEKIQLAYRYKEESVEQEVADILKSNINDYQYIYDSLNANDSILSISDDRNVLNMFLVLKNSDFKIDVYINDAERRAVAKNTYIDKVRNLNYLELLTNENKNSVLIVSSNYDLIANLNLNEFNRIIVLNNKSISISGFKMIQETTTVQILEKNG